MLDVIVVGAGIAGCAAARAFARQGRSVLIIERNLAEPDRIVGELLQPGGVLALEKLGLSAALEGIDAQPVKGYHMTYGQESASWWYCDGTPGSAKEEPQGRAFHHGRFVMGLRREIGMDENVQIVEGRVTEILRDGDAVAGVACSVKDGEPINYTAHLVVLADGPSSNFNRQFTKYTPQSQSRFWGLELHDAELPIKHYAHSIIGSGGPILMYQISETETRLLVDIHNDEQAAMGGASGVRAHLLEHVLPLLPPGAQVACKEALAHGRLRSMPNVWLTSSKNKTPGLMALGDAANMRHPIGGAGMTVAIRDALTLSEVLEPAAVPTFAERHLVLNKMASFHWKRKAYASALNILAQSLYLLFLSDDRALNVIKAGFVQYLKQGEEYFAEPVALMGAILESPYKLCTNFMSLAFWTMGHHVRQSEGIPARLWAIAECPNVLYKALTVLLPPIVDEFRS